jgi:AraC family transcriptional regulator
VINVELINKPEIKELGERNVAYVSFVGNYMGNVQVFKELFGKLCGWASSKQLINNETIFMSVYHDDPHTTPPDKLKLDVCMTLKENVEVENEIKKKTLPGGKYVVMRVELFGPEEYGPAWNKVVEWIKENNKEIDMSRPSYEIYLNRPEEHPEHHHILDVCMAVK